MVTSGKYKLSLFTFFIIANIFVLSRANTIKNNNLKDDTSLSISDNYAVLRDDVQWFFQRLENAAGIVERMLPNITNANAATNRTLTETTRINLLTGLKHLFAGIKEIAITFKQSFETNHVRQLEKLKYATDYVHAIIKTLKMWFTSLRVLLAQIFRMYNSYLPEVLLGKCFGRYVVTAHPGRGFYEYPFLLLTDVVKYILEQTTRNTQNDATTTTVGDYSSIDEKQNEISHNDQDDDTVESNNSKPLEHFSLSDNVAFASDEMESWQVCLKLYTADSIARRLKLFFLAA